MSDKIYLNLLGGLGNQLFQLAAGYAFAQKNHRTLHILYKSKPDAFGRSLLVDQLLTDRLQKDIVFQAKGTLGITFRLGRKIRRKIFPKTYIEENVRSKTKDIQLEKTPPGGPVELFGFWQDEDFFCAVADDLRNNLRIDVALEGRYRDLQQEICDTNSVCIGARLYEDNGHDHSSEAEDSFRGLIQQADRLRAIFPDTRFFVFSSSENKILEKMCSRRKNFKLARTKDGITDTLQTLRIMSQCKHHIFNQSTYYWWAAWLSETIHGVGNCIVIPPAKLFCRSRTGIPPRWIQSARKIA